MRCLLPVLFTLLTLTTHAQTNPPTYARDWLRADSLAKKGLPKSALDVANRIYARAKADRNPPQIVKAALYRLVYQPYTDETTYVTIISSLRQDIAETPAPARNILQSILAETYWNYYQQNRYKFGQRTALDGPAAADSANADVRTWDLRRLVAETTAQYEASLTPAGWGKRPWTSLTY